MKPLAARLALLLAAAPAFAQPVIRPERGSPVRTAILDALRSAAEQDTYSPTRRGVTFTRVELRVAGDYAFVDATPMLPGGCESDHCERVDPDLPGDSNIIAVMGRVGGAWHVLESVTCMTDVAWSGPGWSGRYGAPASLDPQFLQTARFPANATTFSAGDGFLSLRSEPSASRGQRLAQMPDDTRVSIQRCGGLERVEGDWGRWCRVRHNRQEGWAFSHYLSF